ncbi:Uncharacterised protein [Turicibacter sanguinis]|nr:Uncharacterised protein [Turicibacter sanguinis]
MIDANELVKIFFDAYMPFVQFAILCSTLKIIGTKMKYTICDEGFMCLGFSKKGVKNILRKFKR